MQWLRLSMPSSSAPATRAASPAAASLAAASPAAVARLVRRLAAGPDDLIELLHHLQVRHGYLAPSTLAEVARQLGLPPSHVLGVASFYHLFRRQPPPPHALAVCLGTSCFVLGAALLARRLEQRLGVVLGGCLDAGHHPRGWALQAVGCVGACGQGPVLLVDGVLDSPRLQDPAATFHRRLTALGVPQTPAFEPAQGARRP